MNYIINKIIEDLSNGLDKKDVQNIYFGHSYSLSGDVLDKGVIEIVPVSSTIESVTTGTTEQSTNTIRIILMKSFKNDVYRNAKRESASDYLNRIMDGRNADGSIMSNTVRNIVRRNLRQYGSVQRSITIDYDTEDIENKGSASATMTIVQEELTTQSII